VIEFLYAALNSEYGIIIETTDVERLRQQLYKIRREVPDAGFDALSFVPSPTNEAQLWIVKREAHRGDTPSESDSITL
jgi:hypothetical protein